MVRLEEVREYSESQIRDLESREERLFSKRDWFVEDDLQAFREQNTLIERMAYMKSPDERTEDENSAYSSRSRRLVDFWDGNERFRDREDEKIRGVMRSAYNHEMREIFNGLEEEHSELGVIKITRSAYDKALAIAKRTVEVSNNPNEIYMNLLRDREDDSSVITDVYIPHQEASPSLCSSRIDKAAADMRDIERDGKKVVGWSHSHGNHPTFHSATDMDNLHHIPYTEGEKLEVKLDTFSSETPWKLEVYRAPSIVVNARGDEPSLSISFGYREFCDLSPKIYVNTDPRFEIIEDEGNIVDIQDIDRQLWDKFTSPAGFKRDFVRPEDPIDESEGRYTIPLEDWRETLKEVQRLKINQNSLEERISNLEGSYISWDNLRRALLRLGIIRK